MEERLSMKQAAERLGVSVDTIRRRLKRGELVGEKEPTPQGYEWRIILPAEEHGAGDDAAQDATEPPQSVAIELELLRERIDELKQERDDWKAQAQRSAEAERELRILLRQAQELALPEKATRQDAPGAPQITSEAPERTGTKDSLSSTPKARRSRLHALWALLRGEG